MFPYQTNSSQISKYIELHIDNVVNALYYKKHTFEILEKRRKLLNKSRVVVDGKIVTVLGK